MEPNSANKKQLRKRVNDIVKNINDPKFKEKQTRARKKAVQEKCRSFLEINHKKLYKLVLMYSIQSNEDESEQKDPEEEIKSERNDNESNKKPNEPLEPPYITKYLEEMYENRPLIRDLDKLKPRQMYLK